MAPGSSKPRLRRAARAAVAALDPDARRADEAALIGRLLARDDFQVVDPVLLYVATFAEEIDTRPLLDAVVASGRTLVLPRVDAAARRLVLHRIDDPARQLVPATLGIPEPDHAAPEVEPATLGGVLVPGLLFDRDGYRLGRGGGFYDRLLADVPRRVPCWSLAFDCQLVGVLPREPHDQPVHVVLTPTATIDGRRPVTG